MEVKYHINSQIPDPLSNTRRAIKYQISFNPKKPFKNFKTPFPKNFPPKKILVKFPTIKRLKNFFPEILSGNRINQF